MKTVDRGSDDELEADVDSEASNVEESESDTTDDEAVDEAELSGDANRDEEIPSTDTVSEGGTRKKNHIRFRPSEQFPTLKAYWTAALKNAGFVVCRVGSCRFLSTNLEKCMQHHAACLRVFRNLDKVMCVLCHRGKYFGHDGMIRHYVKKHKKTRPEAEGLLTVKRRTATVREKCLEKIRPTEEEIDKLNLFGD